MKLILSSITAIITMVAFSDNRAYADKSLSDQMCEAQNSQNHKLYNELKAKGVKCIVYEVDGKQYTESEYKALQRSKQSEKKTHQKAKELQAKLLKAIAKNDLKRVKRLMKQGAKPEGYGDSSKPVAYAVFSNKYKIAKYLISKVGLKGIDQKKLIFERIKTVKMAQLLLDQGVKFNEGLDYYGNNFFMHSIDDDHYDLAKFIFLKQKFDIRVKNKENATSLHLLCRDATTIKDVKVCKKGKCKTVEKEFPPDFAGKDKMARFLISKGDDVNAVQKGWGSVLQRCSFYLKDSTIELMIQKGANPNVSDIFGTTIFSTLDEKPKKTKADRFLRSMMKKYGGKITTLIQENSELCNHVLNKNYKEVKASRPKDLEKIQCRNSSGFSMAPIHLAILENDGKILDILFRKKINWNTKDQYTSSALHYAVRMNDEKLVKRLLQKKADPNQLEKDTLYGHTASALEYAVSRSEAITALLLKHGAKPDRFRYSRNEIFAQAVYANNKNTISLLIKKGSDYSLPFLCLFCPY